MSVGVTTEELADALERYADVVERYRKVLIGLDRAIGDGDHGENMHRGMKAVRQSLDEHRSGSPGPLLRMAATTLVSKVGGAAGPLYGTAFLRAASAVGDAEEIDPPLLVEALRAALKGVTDRGKAQVGDKTMVDAWRPAVDAAAEAVEGGADVCDALAAATDAARSGMESTVPLVARKGRASYLGERSRDHLDPGAASSFLLFATLARDREATLDVDVETTDTSEPD